MIILSIDRGSFQQVISLVRYLTRTWISDESFCKNRNNDRLRKIWWSKSRDLRSMKEGSWWLRKRASIYVESERENQQWLTRRNSNIRPNDPEKKKVGMKSKICRSRERQWLGLSTAKERSRSSRFLRLVFRVLQKFLSKEPWIDQHPTCRKFWWRLHTEWLLFAKGERRAKETRKSVSIQRRREGERQEGRFEESQLT